MNGDFGTELDAALSAHLAELHAAAAQARSRLEAGIGTLASAVPAPRPPVRPVDEPSPVVFDGPPFDDDGFDDPVPEEPRHRSGAAVSFDLDEAPVDAEGIPVPEENP